MLSNKFLLVSVSILFCGLFGWTRVQLDSNAIQLDGNVLFSFSDEHFIMQTDRFYYRIAKEGLMPETSKKLELAILSNQKLAISIPKQKINYVWPVSTLARSDKAKADNQFVIDKLISKKLEKDGQYQLTGSLVFSFSEPYYLIQANDTVYQINKSKLDEKQIAEFKKVNLGDQVQVIVPKEAINYSWNFKQNSNRQMASVEPPDVIQTNKTFTTLKGVVLFSASEPDVIVQSKDMVFHLKRKGIIMKDHRLLDVNGAHVQLIVPVKDIDFYWSTNIYR